MATFQNLVVTAVSQQVEYRTYKDGRIDQQTGQPQRYAAYDVAVSFGQHVSRLDPITQQPVYQEDVVVRTFTGESAQIIADRHLQVGMAVMVDFAVFPRKGKDGVIYGYEIQLNNVAPMQQQQQPQAPAQNGYFGR